jgi:hypothetical protein
MARKPCMSFIYIWCNTYVIVGSCKYSPPLISHMTFANVLKQKITMDFPMCTFSSIASDTIPKTTICDMA